LNRFLFHQTVHIEFGERGVHLNNCLSQTAQQICARNSLALRKFRIAIASIERPCSAQTQSTAAHCHSGAGAGFRCCLTQH
jgi:hypothetical protein